VNTSIRPAGPAAAGFGDGLLGVIIFSGSLPATRVAVAGTGLSPLFVTAARATVAAALGAILLAALRQVRPATSDLLSLAIVALGVVVGFPLLTALALREVTAAHSIVFVGLLPLATAIFGVIRGGERPRAPFWFFSLLGSLMVGAFAWLRADGAGPGAVVHASLRGDLLMLAAIVVCGLGYAEGGRLSRRLGGWQVICWALLLASPLMLLMDAVTFPATWHNVGTPAWIGLAYVSVFSMLIGFVFWYRGLALGGIARVGQLQLLQPFFGLLLAGLLLHEQIAWSMIAVTAAVVVCVGFARRYA
jgi:drug/metabolite transporter (DMT)-like permease